MVWDTRSLRELGTGYKGQTTYAKINVRVKVCDCKITLEVKSVVTRSLWRVSVVTRSPWG